MQRGCKICDRYKEHYYKDHLNGKGVEFYELMHEDFKQHLRMPTKFPDYCKRELPDIVDLKGPSGSIWPVGLKKTSDEMLLQSGWKEFVEAQRICEKDLLIFKYDGHSGFDVSIFDENRFKKTSLLTDSNLDELETSENSVEILNVKSRHKGMSRASSHSQNVKISKPLVHPKYKRKHWPYVSAQETRDNVGRESVDVNIHEKLAQLSISMSKRRALTDEEEKGVLQLAHAIRPHNPSFLAVLQPGSVYNSCFMVKDRKSNNIARTINFNVRFCLAGLKT